MDQRATSAPEPWLAVGREIGELLQRIDPAGFRALLDAMADPARRWFFSGQGRSGLAARMAAMRLMHLGRQSHFVGEATAPSVRKGDGLLMVSGSGETPVSLGFAKIARAEGATLAVVTHKPESTLAAMADVVLTIPAENSVQFGGSLFEQAALIMLDSVVMALAADDREAHARMAYRHTNLQ